MTDRDTRDQHIHEGCVRTDMYCHDCGRNFLAMIDYDVDGNHVIVCPLCGHQHCRVIEKGKITSDRWDGRYERVEVSTERVWKDTHVSAQTSSAAAFLREKWLNYGDR